MEPGRRVPEGTWLRALLAASIICCGTLAAQQEPGLQPVRFSEGVVHGFLELHSEGDTLLAHGELIQVPGDSTIESTTRFFFRDGSRFEETVEFTQHQTFRLKHYHLVQRGPAFGFDLDASLNADGSYSLSSQSHDKDTPEQDRGGIEAKTSLGNGMPLVVAKNLKAGDSATVALVAFTPKPQLIALRVRYSGKDSIMVGGHSEAVLHWTLTPDVGGLKGFFAKLLGKLPEPTQVWVAAEGAPIIVRVIGPLYLGPIWRIDLSGVRWATAEQSPSAPRH
jgi:hypothetical protein